MKVIRTMKYKGAEIYVLQHWMMWQYFFTHKGKSYTQYAYAWPRWWRWLMLPFKKELYDQEEIESAESSILTGAVRSIDEINKNKYGKRNRKESK